MVHPKSLYRLFKAGDASIKLHAFKKRLLLIELWSGAYVENILFNLLSASRQGGEDEVAVFGFVIP